jgi:putative NADH-flavin reductase
VARILIVGCGCRGRRLARALIEANHAVRATTRREDELEEIEAAGAQAVIADPDHLSTLLPEIEGVSAVCWLMGTAVGDEETIAALHGPRLQSLLERLVDSPARGVVYEAAGSVEDTWLEQGAALVGAAAETYRMPVEVVRSDPADYDAWLEEMRSAVERVLTV